MGTPLREKAGQMIMAGFRGLSARDAPILRDVRELFLGGVVLFDRDVPSRSPIRNIVSPAQVQDLIRSLQKASKHGLIVAVDQEGGMITRLREPAGFPPTVSARVLGAKDDPAWTYAKSLEMAKTLKALGFTLNLAPVVDVDVNPKSPAIGALERSFSHNPETVARHALSFIDAHHSQGVSCALKHFPGHGSAAADSHLGLTDITATWSEKELVPYRRIIGEGMADAVMTAHVYHSGLDEALPATLSAAVVAGLLRETLGFEGVVISDDMQMGAIAREYGFEDALRLAVQAGMDILVYANNSIYDEDAPRRAAETLVRCVESGKIPETRIDASWRRIMKMKNGRRQNAIRTPSPPGTP